MVSALLLLIGFFVQEPQVPVFRSTTRLVQVNVVVHGRDGKPVTGLKKEDFRIFEKGKPQTISVFNEASLDKLPASPVTLPPHVYSNQLAQRNGAPGSITAILLDSVNTTFPDQIYGRRAVIDFLLQVNPSDHIAIYELMGSRFRILHDYTTDASELIRILKASRSLAIPDLESVGGRGAEMSLHRQTRILRTLQALEMIANHLASVPGRKNLVWVSDGFPLVTEFRGFPTFYTLEMDHAVRALNDAAVAVYPVDAGGLRTDPRLSFTENPSGSLEPLPPRLPSNRDTMLKLADRTGGRAYYDTNNLKKAIREAIADSDVTYTLGYHPEDGDMDGKFREIKVTVNRPGVKVRNRRGYFAMKPADASEKVRKAEMDSAVWSPLDATALPMNARVDFVEKPDPRSVHVLVQLDPSNLSLERKDDRYSGELDIIMVQKDERGTVRADGIHDTLDLNMKQESYNKIMKEGLIYEKTFPRIPGATNIRLVVRDVGTGAVGSITVPYKEVEVPVPPKGN